MEWLQRHIWPAEAKLTADDVYWGTRLACVEMIRTGTVRFWDMYWQPDAVARAVADAGLRATVGPPLIDGGDPAGADDLKRAALYGLAELDEVGSDLVSASLAPHAIYTVGGVAGVDRPSAAEPASRFRSTSPRPRARSTAASPPTASARPTASTGSACSVPAPCSPMGSGSTSTSAS